MGSQKKQSSRWQKEAAVPEEDFEALIVQCVEEGKELTQASVLKLAGAGHVSQSSGENEWYTPPDYIELARKVMGCIDLDPASSKLAQKNVQASAFYTIDVDGLSKPWHGNVWLNPPYSKDCIGKFASKLRESVESKSVQQAVMLVNNATDTAWFQDVVTAASALCFTKGRISFIDKNGKPSNKPLQGQTFLYFGGRIKGFCKAFCEVGFCCVIE